jgi:hypothetical protein
MSLRGIAVPTETTPAIVTTTSSYFRLSTITDGIDNCPVVASYVSTANAFGITINVIRRLAIIGENSKEIEIDRYILVFPKRE